MRVKTIRDTTENIIWLSLLSLPIITPILFTTRTTELFEVPKMLFVYLAAAVATTATFLKFVIDRKITIPKNLILITLLLFLAVQIASTVTSIDKFTSVFGYPSRLNGGLLSQIAYLVIFFCALVNLERHRSQKLIIAAILTALAVSLWGIPSHFGRDPNCLVLTGNLNASCWQEDFDPTKRIFSTLGQPNWLASYLVLILPLSIAQIFMGKHLQRRIFFALVTLIIFIAFVFTNSRAGLAGLVISLLLFFALIGVNQIKRNWKFFAILMVPVIVIAVLAGSTLAARISEVFGPKTPQGPTESAQIRLIVWQGAVEIFKHNPILGTGPETFAYAYYQYRPREHNLTSEWNFFYNKAHNEYLNYLANVGILGFLAYVGLLVAIIFTLARANTTLAKSVLAGVLGYQVTIFFGFSTVATQTLMFLAVAAAVASQKVQDTWQINLKFPKTAYQLAIGLVTAVLGIWVVVNVARIFVADVLVARAKQADEELAPQIYRLAISTYPATNPFYLADAASFSYSAPLAQKAQSFAPNNLLILRKVANTYFLLALTDPSYQDDATRVAQRLTQLAPTDPGSYLTTAKIQIGFEQIDLAKASLQKALELKPDYLEAQEIFEQLTTNN